MVRTSIIAYAVLYLAAVVVAAAVGGTAPAVGVAAVGLLGPLVFHYRLQELRPWGAQRSRR